MNAPIALLAALGAASSIVIPALAMAQESSIYDEANFVEEQPTLETEHDLAITLSPLHFIFPVVELTGEYRAMDQLGVAAILGAGSSEGELFIQVGAQGHYYLLGDFDHGMQLGVEFVGFYDSGREGGGTGTGYSAGPYLGYKVAASFGLTFMAQVGYQFGHFNGEFDGGISAPQSQSQPLVLLNLNLGWSF